MTAYNRARYIAEAIESVLAQKFSDFELIVVDDGSTDETLEIARRYVKDPRIRTLLNEKNLSDYPNRNQAARFALGHYLKFLDADDTMYPHCLSVMVEQMERFPEAGIGIENEAEHRWSRPYPILLSSAAAYREHFFGRGILSEGPSAVIIRGSVFREFGGFLPERHISDTEFWLRIARKHSLLLCPAGLTWWRQHDEQEHRRGISRGPVIARRYQVAVSALMAQDCPLGAEERGLALQQVRRKYCRGVLSAIARGRLSFVWSLYKGAQETQTQGPG